MSLKQLTLVLLSAACVLAANYTVDDCPASIPHDRHLRVFRDTCYSFKTSTRREFDAAERECESNQGRLVIIRDEATQDFLYNTLRHDLRYNGVVWIGLSDRVKEGHFVWVDGTPATYTHWASGQPGILGGLEDCVGMNIHQQGQWNDYQCQGFLFISSSHVFVCEYPLGPTTVPPTATGITTTTPAMAPSTTTSSQPMPTTPPITQTKPPPTSPQLNTAQQPLMTTAPPATTTAAAPTSTVPEVSATQGSVPADVTATGVTGVTGACPPFSCAEDCGMNGYKTDDSGCLVCECDIST